MDIKMEVLTNIILQMKNHLSAQNLSILKEVLLQNFSGINISSENVEVATNSDINIYILEMFNIKKAGRLSQGTVSQYIRHVKLLIDTVQKSLIKIDQNDIEYFLLKYKNRGNSNRTVNNCKRFLSAFFTWMRKSKLISENPVENIDAYKETSKMIEHLEPEQWEQLKTGCHSNRDRSLLEFLRCTAMRDGEVPGVRVCDVDWHDGRIAIYGHKSDRYRVVCIDRVAQDYLRRYLKERGISCSSLEPLFISRTTHKALGRSGIYCVIKLIAKRAQLDINVYPHLLRKTTATNIIKRGGSSEEAGEYLGHSERNTADRYYVFKGEDHIMEIFKKRIATV